MLGRLDLYHLIRSLSRSEKRYFTLDAQKSGRQSSRYLSLFRAINSMDEYDEEQLQRDFGRRLSDDKARLYDAILRSMRDYRSAHSRAARIKEMLLDARFLYERGLYEQCEERLAGARKMALELEDQIALLDINKEERRVANELLRRGREERSEQLQQEKEEALQRLQEELTFLDLHDRLILPLIRNPQGLSRDKRSELSQRYRDLLAQPVQPDSLQARLRYYQSLAFLNQLLGRPAEVFRYFSKVVEVWNAHPVYKEEEFTRYIQDAFNLLHAAFADRQYLDRALELLQELEGEQPHNYQDRKVLFQRTAVYRLVYYINYGDVSDPMTVLEPISKGLDTYDLNPNTEFSIRFNAAILLFLAGRHAYCIEWLDELIGKARRTAVRQDIQSGGRLLQYLALIELDDFDRLESAGRSVARYFAKQPPGPLRDFAVLVVKQLRAWLNAPTLETDERLRQMLDAIHRFRTDSGRIPLGLDELLIGWVRAQLEEGVVLDLMRSVNP